MQAHTDPVMGKEAGNTLEEKKFLDHVELVRRHHAGLPISNKHRHVFCKDA